MSDLATLEVDPARALIETAEADLFRLAMRRHAAGTCIVTAGTGEDVNGLAATATTAFSMEPPSFLVCVNRTSSMAEALVKGAQFGVTVLGRAHEAVVEAFSRKPSGRARFDHQSWRFAAHAPPWLDGAPVNMICVAEALLDYGTHKAVIGRVRHVVLGPDSPSLIYRDGSFL